MGFQIWLQWQLLHWPEYRYSVGFQDNPATA
jgi:hypothetical protein